MYNEECARLVDLRDQKDVADDDGGSGRNQTGRTRTNGDLIYSVFFFCVCVWLENKKKTKTKTKKSIGFKKSERTNGRHKIFKKDFVCCFVCLFVFSLFRARFLSSLSCFPSADRCIEMPQIFQRWKRKIEFKFL